MLISVYAMNIQPKLGGDVEISKKRGVVECRIITFFYFGYKIDIW